MDVASIVLILRALLVLAPAVPQLIQSISLAISLLESGQAPTADQKAQIDALLEKAHAALQAA